MLYSICNIYKGVFYIENNKEIIKGFSNAILKGLNYVHENDSKTIAENVLKFFPAEPSGGLSMIKAIAAPYTMMKFIPTGGINENNMEDYLKYDRILAIGGSWMVKSSLVKSGEFEKIKEMSKTAVARVKEIRG